MKTAIIIITYNNARLIQKQVELIRRFCKDEHDIIIVDNSTDEEAVKAIDYYNQTMKCHYIKTHATSKNGSDSHSFAANLAYLTYKDSYNRMLWLDHDNFAIKPFSVDELLGGKIIAGVGQNKNGTEYFWPGCVAWNNDLIDKSLVNFSTNWEMGLDTGGMLYKLIERHGKDNTDFWNEILTQNPNFNKSMYNFYALMKDATFMHFIGGSRWNVAEDNDHEERINSLLNILDEKTATT